MSLFKKKIPEITPPNSPSPEAIRKEDERHQREIEHKRKEMRNNAITLHELRTAVEVLREPPTSS
jgi:hypothetical protein